ncbi:hypothetical protein SDC9_125325 [bioreactor metagenome]|uniref:Uncharacterized protein n=1 Tax=bioreactor metagenome TaxID=1076179 RepID=A0A645CN61_9ZZZZ
MPDNMNLMVANQNTLQQLSPDLYSRVKPHIDEIVKELNKQEISEDTLNAVIDEFFNSLSKLENMPPENMLPENMPMENEPFENMPFENMPAVPAFNGYGYGYGPRQPYRPGPYWNPYRRRWRNMRGLSTDTLLRLLLLRQLGYLTF